MGQSIRRVSNRLLTAMDHAWEDATETLLVDEYTYDPRNPREFYVNPPNDGTGAVRAVYSEFPDDLGDYTTLTTTWGEQVVTVPDEYAEAIANFILHRAFSKEAEWALDPARAKQHFELYLEMATTKSRQDIDWSGTGD